MMLSIVDLITLVIFYSFTSFDSVNAPSRLNNPSGFYWEKCSKHPTKNQGGALVANIIINLLKSLLLVATT